MPAVWKQDDIEILVGRNELVHDEEHIVHGYIGVHGAVCQQELTLQIPGQPLVRLVVVVGGSVRVCL